MIDVEIKVTYGSFAPPKTLLDDIAEIKTKEHTHDNIDAINQVTESMLVDIRSNTNTRHSHSNKDIIDSISENELNNITENTAARHSHANTDTLGKLGESGGKLTYDGKPIGGSDKIKIKRREFDMSNVGEDYVDGFAFIDIFATNTISFFVKENLPNNARIVDFDIEFNGNIYSSSELAINDLISCFDNIQIHPSLRYDAGMAAYLAVTIACNSPTALLYSNIGNEYNLTKLFLYYIDSEVEIIPYV